MLTFWQDNVDILIFAKHGYFIYFCCRNFVNTYGLYYQLNSKHAYARLH